MSTHDVLDELRAFRTRIFKISIDDNDIARQKLDSILDEYQNEEKYKPNHFKAVAEEYHITQFGLENVRIILILRCFIT